ncbi:hypothetical protein J6590_083074, partial [Homalodisca vitripennis]
MHGTKRTLSGPRAKNIGTQRFDARIFRRKQVAALVQQDIGTQRFDVRILRWKHVGNTRAPAVAELSLTVLNMHGTKRNLSGPRRGARIVRWKQFGNTRGPSVAELSLTELNMHGTKRTLSGPRAKKIGTQRFDASILSSCRTKFDSAQYARHKANFERPSCNKTLAHNDLTLASSGGSNSCRTKFDSAQYARHKANFERPSCNKTLAHKRRDARIVRWKQFGNTRAPAVAELSLTVLNMHGTKRTLSGP